jgi:hypothetical protein
MAFKGFVLEGREDYSDIVIRHSTWPGSSWRLMIPEYGWIGESVRSRGVNWPVREGREVSWRWTDPGSRNEFDGSAGVINDEEIEYRLNFTNTGEEKWGRGSSSLICLISGGVPAFHDYEGHRTFVHECGKGFVDIDAIQGGVWAEHRMWGGKVPALAGDRPAVERFMVKVSRDGEFVLGIATDDATGVSCNHQLRMSCIHSNPLWGPLSPGESKNVRGKIYLFRGTREDVLDRYDQDFGRLCV